MSITVITKIGPRVLPQARMQQVPWLPKGVITQPRPWKRQLRHTFARSRGAQVFALREQRKVPWEHIVQKLNFENEKQAKNALNKYKRQYAQEKIRPHGIDIPRMKRAYEMRMGDLKPSYTYIAERLGYSSESAARHAIQGYLKRNTFSAETIRRRRSLVGATARDRVDHGMRLRMQGKSWKEIADTLGYLDAKSARTSIHGYRVRQKLPPSPRPLVTAGEKRAQQAIRLREQGQSWKQIAETLGFANAKSAHNTVYKYRSKRSR